MDVIELSDEARQEIAAPDPGGCVPSHDLPVTVCIVSRRTISNSLCCGRRTSEDRTVPRDCQDALLAQAHLRDALIPTLKTSADFTRNQVDSIPRITLPTPI